MPFVIDDERDLIFQAARAIYEKRVSREDLGVAFEEYCKGKTIFAIGSLINYQEQQGREKFDYFLAATDAGKLLDHFADAMICAARDVRTWKAREAEIERVRSLLPLELNEAYFILNIDPDDPFARSYTMLRVSEAQVLAAVRALVLDWNLERGAELSHGSRYRGAGDW